MDFFLYQYALRNNILYVNIKNIYEKKNISFNYNDPIHYADVDNVLYYEYLKGIRLLYLVGNTCNKFIITIYLIKIFQPFPSVKIALQIHPCLFFHVLCLNFLISLEFSLQYLLVFPLYYL